MALTARRTEPVTILQRERALRPDLFLILPYLTLSALGIVMVYTASAPRNELLDLDPASTVRRHIIFVIIGFAVFIGSSLIGGRTLRSLSVPFYMASLVALGIVLEWGRELKGAQRWIQVGPLQLQPSEFAKVAVILALAVLLSNAGNKLRWFHIGRAMLLVGVPAVLIFMQPDLGTMLVFAFAAVVMLFIAGTSMRQLAFIALAAVVMAVALFQVNLIEEYQIERVTSFLDGGANDVDARYNQRQSEIAIGSGGFFGKGLFEGTQTNLSFVPEQSSDFIFTAVGEQLGFVGGSIVLGLYAMIVWRLLVAALNGRERFSQLVAIGIAALLVFHVFVNVGMTLTLLPVTGLPLPFLSAGGTFFIAMSLALGLAHSVWMRRSPVPDE